MPVLSVHDLSYRLPDGRVLFQNLDLAFGRERTGIVGRNGAGKSSLVAILAGLVPPSSGSVHGTGRIALLLQMADVGEAETVADLFGVRHALALVERASSGEADADEVAAADWTLEARLEKALAAVGLEGVPPGRLLASLSGGQRTRAALAALAFDEPDMILMDEPTNNLDREGRAMVASFLDGWKDGAVVVSHDRALLNRMDRIVELSTLGARVYGGNFDAYREHREAEREAAAKALESAARKVRQAARGAGGARAPGKARCGGPQGAHDQLRPQDIARCPPAARRSHRRARQSHHGAAGSRGCGKARAEQGGG